MDRFGRENFNFKQTWEQSQKEANQEWSTSLENSVLSARQLEALDVCPRPLLIDPWARQGDLGFIFAARGVGKTWIGIHIAHCLASGKDFGPWKVSLIEGRILYMDGEMPLADVQYRNHLLGAAKENLFYLNHEILFDRSTRTLNLSDKDLQDAVLSFCKENRFAVLILDNLSCLISGVDENNGIDWEKILPWLLDLRRTRVTVIFIHHSGREGLYMRGHSKREDPAAWIIHLKAPKSDPDHEVQGAHFISSFDKYRNAPQRPYDLEWNFMPLDNGQQMVVRFVQCNPLDVFLDLVANGINECQIIAQEMEISQAAVSRLAKSSESKNLIEIKKRKYYIKTSGPRTYNPSED